MINVQQEFRKKKLRKNVWNNSKDSLLILLNNIQKVVKKNILSVVYVVKKDLELAILFGNIIVWIVVCMLLLRLNEMLRKWMLLPLNKIPETSHLIYNNFKVKVRIYSEAVYNLLKDFQEDLTPQVCNQLKKMVKTLPKLYKISYNKVLKI